MRYSAEDLQAAAQAGVITPAQEAALRAFLDARRPAAASDAPRFDIVHLLWYAGALIVISAMGLFSTMAFAGLGGAALTATALIYAVAFWWTGHYLWHVKNLRTPGGLCIAVAVGMMPLAVYGVQEAFGLWSEFGKPDTIRSFYIWVKGSFIFMELATIVAALVALAFYRFPFIVFLMAVALWFLSMDLVPWITGTPHGDFETGRKVSIGFGAVMVIAAVIVHLRQRSGNFAFWLYLFGVMTFWGGITATSNGTNLDKALYCAMNVVFLGIAVVLGRRVFAVFGALGIAIYLGDLAEKLFRDSLLFPFALSLIGIAIIALGLFLHRRLPAIEAWCDARLPKGMQRLRVAPA
ncbi:hypothetical protein [Rhodopseudomonas palustris]|uniref:hypothetical protein n=1 Tax=Rhodopseudomonas palustris TaxID=1076 RepID=UPI000CEC1C18|nr:hypothetical protein [Rhodopseudomonas palustris]PPQ41744.1 hypothetical protein CKO39_20475 [Rhodopseudomonas palustris]